MNRYEKTFGDIMTQLQANGQLSNYQIAKLMQPMKDLIDHFGDVKEISGFQVGKLYILAHDLHDAGIEANQYGGFARNYATIAKDPYRLLIDLQLAVLACQGIKIEPQKLGQACNRLWAVRAMLLEEQRNGSTSDDTKNPPDESVPKGNGA